MDKKYKKIELICWSIVAIVLTILLSVVLIGNSHTTFFDLDDLSFKINDNWMGNLKTIDEYTIEDVDKLTDINLNTKNSDIKLLDSDDKNIHIIVKTNADITSDKYTQINNSSQTLTITNSYNGKNSFFNSSNMIIELKIPKSYNKGIKLTTNVGDIDSNIQQDLNNIIVKSNVGDIKFTKNIKASEISISDKTGDIEVKSLDSDKYIVQNDIGDIEIKSLSGGGSIKSNIGDTECYIEKIRSDISIGSDIGDIELDINNKNDFKINANKRLDHIDTDIQFNNSNTSTDSFKGEYGSNPVNVINLDTRIGDIDIDLE